jgi:hypothetical protein
VSFVKKEVVGADSKSALRIGAGSQPALCIRAGS